MSKNGPQCKIGTRETKALAKALESSYPVNEQTILAKIESFQTAYDKDPMYVPSVPEMKAFLDLQAAQGDLVVPISKISNLRKQVEEGTATMQRVGGTIYIATKSGMVVKVLPNNTMVVTNPSDTSEEGIALHQAFDTFFSKTSEAGPEEDVKEGKNTGIFATTEKKEYWDRSAVEKDTETLYIFTDNTDIDSGSSKIDPNSKYAQKYGKDKHYPKQTAAVIRGLDNAMPISTQRWYHEGAKGDTGMWQDADAEEFEKVIKEEVDSIIEEWKSGKYKKVVIPSGDGFFGEGSRSISKLNKTRVPELYRILTEQLTRLEEAIGKDNIAPFTKGTKAKTKKKAEVLYEDEEITEAKKKAKEFTLISSTQLGANSAWKIAGENYGIEAIQMSNTETYDDLSADERASLEQPYRNACRAAKVSELSLTDAGASSYKKKAAKLSRAMTIPTRY